MPRDGRSRHRARRNRMRGHGGGRARRDPCPRLAHRGQARAVHAGAAHRRPRRAQRRGAAHAPAPDGGRPGDGYHLLAAGLLLPRLPAPHGPRFRDAPVRHPELRSLGPARWQQALRRRRGHAATGRGVLPPRHHEGRVRARRRGLTESRRGSAEPLHARAPGGRRPPRRALSRGLRRPLGARRRQAARGREAGRRPGASEVPRAARPGTRDRRLSAQRSGLDGHEAEPRGRRHRPHRDLRRRALRLQGRPRGRTCW